MPIAYSYVRFSSPKQQLGDSLKRQLDYARNYAAENGLTLSEVSYRDLGVSGFRGRNIEKGAFAGFINAVETGRIAKGSLLLIEQFDRLTRTDLDTALQLFRSILLLDITIVTLADRKIWTKESLQNLPDLVMSILFMARSHEESKAKSERLAIAWKKKKIATASGKVLTKQCPKWLTAKEDLSGFEEIPAMVESVRNVYRCFIGGLGSNAICSKANIEKWAQPGIAAKGWQPSLVKRILLNRAVLGEYQPHESPNDTHARREPVGPAVRGYYPAIIDEATYLQAQAVRGRYGAFPGRRDGLYKNWLAHLLECTCGRSIVRVNKSGPKNPEAVKYYCSGRTRKLSDCEGFKAEEIEGAILNAVSFHIPVRIDVEAQTVKIKEAIDELEGRRNKGLAEQERLIAIIKITTDAVPALAVAIQAVAKETAEAEQQLARKRAELAELPTEATDLMLAISRSISKREDVEGRAALQQNIARIVEKFVIDGKTGNITARLRGDLEPVVFSFRSDAQSQEEEMDKMGSGQE